MLQAGRSQVRDQMVFMTFKALGFIEPLSENVPSDRNKKYF
jgi:hypothetical protein